MRSSSLRQQLSDEPDEPERALLRPSGAVFALKVQVARSLAQYNAFLSETELLTKLSSSSSCAEKSKKHIIQIKDFHADKARKRVSILMELAVSDLFTFLSKRNFKLSVDTMFRIWQGLVAAVSAAHEEGVIHFDLKPANFLMIADRPRSRQKDRTRTVSTGGHGGTRTSAQRKDEDLHILSDQHGPLLLKLADFGLATNLSETR